MSSFFTVPKSERKRKRTTIADPPKKRLATAKPGSRSHSTRHQSKVQKRQDDDDDEDSLSDSVDDSDGGGDIDHGDEMDTESESESDRETETAAEKRLRLAERYLENIKQDVVDDYGFDAAEIDKEIIASRLQEDTAEAKGKVYKQLTGTLAFDKASYALFKSNTQTVTAVATHDSHAYLVTKDLMLSKWKLQDLPQNQFPQTTKKKPKKPPAPPRKQPVQVRIYRGDRRKAKNKVYKGHTSAILAVAVSPDGKYVVTGGADHKIIVYEAENLKPIRVFTQHRSGVTGLVFRRGTNQMYSCSRDRVVKCWSLDELAFVSSLFGHEEAVVDIDALGQEKCISVGSRDRTARYWKVVDEKQLVFRGGARDRKPVPGMDPRSQAQEGSIDRVSMIDDELFVTGGDAGTLTLWSVQKKNPLFAIPRAHGVDPPLHVEQVSAEAHPDAKRAVPPPQPRWITALKTLPYSDVVLSGSWDGYVRVWRLSEDKRRLEAVGVLGGPMPDDPTTATANGVHAAQNDNGMDVESSFEGLSDVDNESTPKPTAEEKEERFQIKGFVNDLSVFERGNRGKDGLCVVAAVGKEHKFGRWTKPIPGAKNGGVVFEIPRIEVRPGVNGHGDGDGEEEGCKDDDVEEA